MDLLADALNNVRTTMDYILMEVEAASMATSCIAYSTDDVNTSDHHPLTASISYDACSSDQDSSPPSFKRIDWIGAEKNGDLALFLDEIRSKLEALYSRLYNDVEDINSNIQHVADILKETADCLLSREQLKKWRDDTLSCLCAQSQRARSKWKNAGSPKVGPLFEENNRLCRAVRKRVRWCAAKSEHLRVQRRDRLFVTHDHRRFMTPQRKMARCSSYLLTERLFGTLRYC